MENMDFSFIRDEDGVTTPVQDKKTITLTQEKFIKIAMETSTELIADNADKEGFRPSLGMLETLIHAQFTSELIDRMFGNEGE